MFAWKSAKKPFEPVNDISSTANQCPFSILTSWQMTTVIQTRFPNYSQKFTYFLVQIYQPVAWDAISQPD